MSKILIEKSGIFTEISGGSQETPQQLLAKILTVDGKGSGLDADSLGGVNYSQYALIKDYYNKSEVDSKISSLGNFNPALYYPKTDVYNKTEINKALDKKANQDDMIQQFNLTNAKVQNLIMQYSRLNETYYNKSEVNKKINNTIDEMKIKNISTSIKYLPSDVVTLELPSEKWKSIQNFELSDITNNITININYQAGDPGAIDESMETRCISGLIFLNKKTEDKTVHITKVSGLNVVKVGNFEDNTYNKGVNILSYFYYNRTIYIVKVA